MTLPGGHIDHVEDGLSKVISQYQGKPRLLARLACYLKQCQTVEDAFHALHEAFRPDSASGFRLDWTGRKVGQERKGSADDVFRLYVKARIAANRSLGKPGDLERVSKILLGTWEYSEWPLAIEIETKDSLTQAQGLAVQELLQAAAPAGVPVYLVTSDADRPFVFSTVAEGVLPAGGLDSVAGSPDAGLLSGVFAP